MRIHVHLVHSLDKVIVDLIVNNGVFLVCGMWRDESSDPGGRGDEIAYDRFLSAIVE